MTGVVRLPLYCCMCGEQIFDARSVAKRYCVFCARLRNNDTSLRRKFQELKNIKNQE